MSDFSRSDHQEPNSRLDQLNEELNVLISSRDEGVQLDIDASVDPFGHTYVAIADVIIACTRMYFGLRNIEDIVTNGGVNDAPQDTR